MAGAVLDTSIVVSGIEILDQLPEPMVISVITIGELVAGLRRAPTDEARSDRQQRLDAVRSAFAPVPVDEQIASHYGDLLAWARDRSRSEKATDLLITATARASSRELVTRDRAQASLAEGAGVAVRLIA